MQAARMAWMPEAQHGLGAEEVVVEAAFNWLHQTSLSLELCARLEGLEARAVEAEPIMVQEAAAEAAVTSAFLQPITPQAARLLHPAAQPVRVEAAMETPVRQAAPGRWRD